MPFAIKSGKGGPKSVPTPPARAGFVLGSRPPSLRAPRIKPLASNTTQYGKQMPRPIGGGFDGTGTTGES